MTPTARCARDAAIRAGARGLISKETASRPGCWELCASQNEVALVGLNVANERRAAHAGLRKRGRGFARPVAVIADHARCARTTSTTISSLSREEGTSSPARCGCELSRVPTLSSVDQQVPNVSKSPGDPVLAPELGSDESSTGAAISR